MYVLILNLLRSGTMKTGLSFISSGVTFAVANLLLANVLPVEDYGVVALFVAIVMIASTIGMMGADGVINRNPVAPDGELFGRVAATATLTATVAACLAYAFYHVPAPVAVLLVPMVVAFAITRAGGAFLQSRLGLIPSLFLANSANYLLLASALACLFLDLHDPLIMLYLLAVAQVVLALGSMLGIRYGYASEKSRHVYSWREALAVVVMGSGLQVMVQLERLVTPRILSLEDLATLGVLLAVVGPPFRLLQLALGYELLPALRQARGRANKKRLILKQSLIALVITFSFWVLVWFAVPLVERHLLSEEYDLRDNLVLAALVAGTLKGFSGIARSSVIALASVRGIQLMGFAGWGCVAIAIAAAAAGAGYGLPGVVYGVAVGWLTQLVAACLLVTRILRRPVQPPGTEPAIPGQAIQQPADG